ncbi:MAG: dUTP diphosphatase [Candidatus Paceibacterota bacterium]|jgi:dUTP pyrophosphatase
MKIKIKRIDKSLPMPEYHTTGAVAFDLYSRIDVIVQPKSLERLPTNIIVKIPEGFMLEIKDRSSTLKKKGLLVSTGFIDNDFCGESDEILLQVYNITEKEVIIEKGERLGQGVFIKIEKAEWEEVDLMDENSRGGFGTTGHK